MEESGSDFWMRSPQCEDGNLAERSLALWLTRHTT
jgi:hypothetical protein